MERPADNMTDTIAMAKTARQNQGSYEMEVTFGEEADLHKHYKSCDKYPGHIKFIPIGEFCLEHLPAQYQDPDLVNLIRAQAALTVLVHVKSVSDERPNIHPSAGTAYPFIKYRGNTRMGRTGTGIVFTTEKNPEWFPDDGLCECDTCFTTGQRQKVEGVVWIETATHVVFDQQESMYTKCHLDYNSSNMKLKDLPTLDRMKCMGADINTDKTRMVYYTHDMKLIDRLDKMLHLYKELRKKLREKYSKVPYQPLSISSDSSNLDTEHRLTVIVSHPHGCAKMVTVGVWTDRPELGVENTQYIYTTETCPGSSGARVYILGAESKYHLHKGSSPTPGFNCSGIAYDDHTRDDMGIAVSNVQLFTGIGRKKLKEIKREANVDMLVTQDTWEFHNTGVSGIPDCALSISGLPPNFSKAKKMVAELMTQIDDSMIGQIRVEEIFIPASKIRHVLGDRGKRLQSLRKYVGMYVIGDRHHEIIVNGMDAQLCVFGLPHNILHARQKVEELLDQTVDDQTARANDNITISADGVTVSGLNVVYISIDELDKKVDANDEEQDAEIGQEINCEEIAIPASKMESIIGKHGDKLRELKQKAKVLIWTRRSNRDPMTRKKILEICGLQDRVLVAKNMIEDLLTQEENHLINETGQLKHWEEIAIPASKVYLVFGKYERRLDMLERRADVLICTYRQHDERLGGEVLEIYGFQQNIIKAKKVVKYFLDQKHDRGQRMRWEEIVIPASKADLVMGQNDEKLDVLEKMANVFTWVSGQSDESQVCDKILEIYGFEDNVMKTKEIVEYILHWQHSAEQPMHWEEIAIPASKVEFVIGKYGEKLWELQENTDVVIMFHGDGGMPWADNNRLVLHGHQHNVMKARKMVQDMLTQADDFLTD